MDARYWKEFENMGEIEGEKRGGANERSPRYSKKHRMSRSGSRSGSRSSSSSSSGSSSRSSSSSSRHHSRERGYSNRNRDHYHSKSPKRSRVRGSSFSSGLEEGGSGWYGNNYPAQSQDIPPSSNYIPPTYPPGPPPIQGQYPGNYQGQNFGNNFHGGYGNYESAPPTNYYPPAYPHGSQPPPHGSQPPPHGSQPPPHGSQPPPHSSQPPPPLHGSQPPPSLHGSQPPPHEYALSTGSSSHPPPNWEIFPDTTLPPPALIQSSLSGDGMANLGNDPMAEEAKKEAIEQELLQQKLTLAKQREDYVRRKFSLNRELNRLKDQKRDLLKEKSKDNERILRENAKLQSEILQKLKSIDNVIEMLTNIIGDSSRLPDVIKEIKLAEKASEKPKKLEKKKSTTEEVKEETKKKSTEKKVAEKEENRVYYDPGLHWCADCNIFPKTLSQYLDHLHSTQHRENSKLKVTDYPWHAGQSLKEKSPPISKDSTAKRIPIRGAQFLVPAMASYCSLCKVWLGDNHCARKHLQSNQHTNTYNEFIKKNPHWEVDWLTERTQSYEKNSEAKHHQVSHVVEMEKGSSTSMLTSLSDQLLAMIAANSKPQEASLPTPIVESSSSSEEDSPGRKSKKKRKKAKKNKHSKERSPLEIEESDNSSKQIKLIYNNMPQRKIDLDTENDSFISEWMPKVEKREPIQIKKKIPEDREGKISSKRSRMMMMNEDSREQSMESDRRNSPYDQIYNDHDEAVIFDKRHSSRDKENLKSKKRFDEESKYERPGRYERESPKERSKHEDKYRYKSSEKYRYEKDERDFKKEDKMKKDLKSYRDVSERERSKKSPPPPPRLKESLEKKRLKVKSERNSDDDGQETSFEKRTSESAAKKKDGKKLVSINLPKTKLPFIGRMPILKKKVEPKNEEKEEAKKETNESESIKNVGGESQPTETTEGSISVNVTGPSLDDLPKSTLIISKRPRLAEPGIVKKEILFTKVANDNLMEQDMDLDDDNAAPKEEEPAKDELHKDFKEALDLLFPEEKKKDGSEEKEGKKENEMKVDNQDDGTVAVAAPASYMMPGYDVNMYPPYYNQQQAFVQQQWAQMGYDQTNQYPQPYSYPPPMEPSAIEAMVQQPPPSIIEQQISQQPKKKKNPPSQRMRRHLQKKREKEASEKGVDDNESLDEGDGDAPEEIEENEDVDEAKQESIPKLDPMKKSDMSVSDLAMLGIDEDDAAAQGFF